MLSPAFARPVAAGLGLMLCVALLACTSTRSRRGAPEESGFLRDYSMLSKQPDYPMALVYINSDTDFTRYDSIAIDSVTLWINEDKGIFSDEEKQMLTDTLYLALYEELGKYFELTDQPSPSTIRIRAALTQAKGANVPLRTLTTVVPQLRAASMAVGLSADVAYTVGTATVEVDVRDSITGERLAASVDEQAGNKALLTTRTFRTWGDFESACRFWARRMAYRAAVQGVQRKPGTEMPDPSGPRRL